MQINAMTKHCNTKRPIAVTLGEPAGIGPDILIQYLTTQPIKPLVLFADPSVLEKRAKMHGLALRELYPTLPLEIVTEHFPKAVSPGVLEPENAEVVLRNIEKASKYCMTDVCSAMVTLPVHKGIINQAGLPFTGHTEFLAEITHTPRTIMMMANKRLKIALATTHLALSEVPSALSQASLRQTLEILHAGLIKYFHCPKPVITVCGLNPHAGESGTLGSEEQTLITPVLEALIKEKDYHLIGPLSADTAFIPSNLQGVDAVLSMYHDQGLPVIKALDFSNTVNITLGLPIIRTSVDHGTALPLAGTQACSIQNFTQALHYAEHMSLQS